MITLVGTQNNFTDALKELCELDYDAIEAYKAAIERLDNINFKESLTEFMEDHQRHVKEITEILNKHNENPPIGPSLKHFLTKGKVIIANLVDDIGILKAMESNEIDTNTAYKRLNDYRDMWVDCVLMLHRGLEDEKRHKLWIEKTLETL